ncbi:M48 family metalloprotease, partial [Escherichia coli]|uniref:M48 family metalloprotease n=1 Tax=Escherichia coli TaxID=562 RepID=UPI00128F184A
IYVFRGMLETTDTEDELASVLAHEAGHVAGRHSLKQFRLSLGIGLLADLLNLNKQSAFVQNLAGLATTLYELGYSRQHERDADNYALRLTLLAGYDPK